MDTISLYLLIHNSTTTSHNNIQQDAKIKVLIGIITALLFPNARIVLCQILSYDFPKIRNLPKIFLRSFENVIICLYMKVYFATTDGQQHAKQITETVICTKQKLYKEEYINCTQGGPN